MCSYFVFIFECVSLFLLIFKNWLPLCIILNHYHILAQQLPPKYANICVNIHTQMPAGITLVLARINTFYECLFTLRSIIWSCVVFLICFQCIFAINILITFFGLQYWSYCFQYVWNSNFESVWRMPSGTSF